MVPPKEIVDIADAPVTPSVRISPDEKWMVIMYYYPLQTIAELSVPELRLGGLRINPRNNDQSRRIYYYDMILKKLLMVQSKKSPPGRTGTFRHVK